MSKFTQKLKELFKKFWAWLSVGKIVSFVVALVIAGGALVGGIFIGKANQEDDNSNVQPPHTHTYATEWSKNATAHWKAATCHDAEKAEIDGHADADKDGDCDICGYIDETHTHTYVTSWSSDVNGHWKEATCGHAVKGEAGAHTANEIGNCTVCGYHVSDPDVSTVEKAIALAYTQKDNVASGMMDWTYQTQEPIYDYDENWEEIIVGYEWSNPSYTNLVYEMGEGYKKTVSTLYGYSEYYGWTKEIIENWFYVYKDGIVGLQRNDEGSVEQINEELTEDVLKGYNFGGTYLDFAGAEGVNGGFGVEEYMSNLYAFIASETNEAELGGANGVVEIINVETDVVDGVYTLNFVYLEMWQSYAEDGTALDDYYAAEYTTVAIDFSLTDDYLIGELNIEVNIYNDEAIAPFENNKVGDYELVEDATPARKSTYSFRQSSETVNPFDLDEMFVTSYDILDTDGETVLEDGAEFSIVKGSYNYQTLFVENVAPATASLSFDKPVLTIMQDGVEIYDASAFYSAENNEIKIYITEVGTYELIVKSYNVTKTYTVNVVYAETSEFAAAAYKGGDWVTDSASMYEGNVLQIKANVNANAQGTMEGVITTAADGSVAADLLYDEESGYYVFYPDVVGTYTLTFTSTDAKKADGLASSTLTVTVNEKPDVAAILDGTYEASVDYVGDFVVTFSDTQVNEGVYSGNMTITMTYIKFDYNTWTEEEKEATCEYTFTYSDEMGFAQTLVSGTEEEYEGYWKVYMTDYQLQISNQMAPLNKKADTPAGEDEALEFNYNSATELSIGLNQTKAYGGSYIVDLNAVADGTQYVISTFDENAKIRIYDYVNNVDTLIATVTVGNPYTWTVGTNGSLIEIAVDAADKTSDVTFDIYVNDTNIAFDDYSIGQNMLAPENATLTYGNVYLVDLNSGYPDGTVYTVATENTNARIEVMAMDSNWNWSVAFVITAGNSYEFTVGDDGYDFVLFVATVDGTSANIDVTIS